jgi:ADP-ribose pyrophosphatase
MELYEDSVIDEQNALVGIFNRIKVDDAAIVVPEFEDGSLLMVENYRHGIKGNLFELPGGLIKNEDKEQPSDTARRELIEETGYICDILEYIGWFYTWPARSTQRNFVFVARGLKKAQAIQNLVQNQLDEFEYIRLYKISKREVLQKIKKGNIQSAITISALFYTFFLRI